jgi:hypothetical protein
VTPEMRVRPGRERRLERWSARYSSARTGWRGDRPARLSVQWPGDPIGRSRPPGPQGEAGRGQPQHPEAGALPAARRAFDSLARRR